MSKFGKAALVGKVAFGATFVAGLAIVGAGHAHATADPAVCDGISKELRSGGNYYGYLINAAAMGYMFDYDTDQQARNIVDSVLEYCPVHAAGLAYAASQLDASTSRNLA